MLTNSTFEEFGYWWLPENPSHKVPGTINCAENGQIELELMGTFSNLPIETRSDFPIIVGYTSKGRMITLVKCLQINWNFSSSGFSVLTILAHFLLDGIHVENFEDLKFTRATFRYQGLDEWVGISGINVNHSPDSINIDFNAPEPLETKILDDLTISVRFSWHASNFGKGVYSTGIDQKTHLRLEYEEETFYEDIIGVVSKINSLLCLAIDKPVGLTEIQFATPRVTRKVGETEYLKDIPVYFQSLPKGTKHFKAYEHEMLFRYPDVEDRFDKLIRIWLEKYEELEPSFNLYFSLIRREEGFLETKFLILIQGLETLHRRTGEKISIPEKDHKIRVKRILESVPGEYRNWLDKRLVYSNEPTLGTRLKELIKPFNDLFGTRKERKSLIFKLVNTRNYLTHYDESIVDRAAHDVGLLPLISKMRALFVLHFLSLNGFDQVTVRNIFQSNRKLNFNIDLQPRIIFKEKEEEE